jgi:hypothetical protein
MRTKQNILKLTVTRKRAKDELTKIKMPKIGNGKSLVTALPHHSTQQQQ